MNVGKLAISAFQRLLKAGMEAQAHAQRAQVAAARKTLDGEVSGVSRQVTEDVSASRLSSGEASVVHTTPERLQEEDAKRAGSDFGLEPLQLEGSSAAVCSPAAELISHNVEERLRAFLYTWGAKLVELQPKVHMSQHLTESGLFLFKCLRQLQLNACCQGNITLADLSNEVLLIHDLIACFWIAMKACSIRTQVPNRTLVSKATGAQPELLGQRELAALIMLDWDVNTMLRLGGFVV